MPRKERMDMELTLKNVTKQYRDKVAVNDASLTLTPGIWGLLGANGAGKTTLMRMVTDILKPTSGKILYNDEDICKLGSTYRLKIGFLPQEFGFFKEFTVTDYLEYIAALKDVPLQTTHKRINDLLEILTLSEVRRKKIIQLSGGMKRRVGIAQALINEPEILIMDEPTAGLDPGERIRFRNLIAEFSRSRIVLISTHIVSDIEYIAARNAIMKEGRIIDIGTTDQLVKQMDGKVFTCMLSPAQLYHNPAGLRIINQRPEGEEVIAVRYLAEGPAVEGSVPAKPRLEDLYLWLFPEAEADKEVA